MEKDKKFGMHCGATKEIFRRAEMLRNNMTEAELKLWQYLKTSPKGFKFRRQHPYGQYILDFYCHKLKLCIEIDGKNHLDKNQQKLDKIRTDVVKSSGLSEIRFTNEKVLFEFESVLNGIEKIIEKSLNP